MKSRACGEHNFEVDTSQTLVHGSGLRWNVTKNFLCNYLQGDCISIHNFNFLSTSLD